MEAMAYGIPVISTQTGGIPELLEGGAGVLVPQGSSQALADAMTELIQNENIRAKLAQFGRAKVEAKFDLILNTKLLLQLMIKSMGCEEKLIL
jgi:glycosyltransferase involved in cell wall biosynthesis